MLHSPIAPSLSHRFLLITSLALLTSIPAVADAATLASQTTSQSSTTISQDSGRWLVADRDDDDDDDDDKKGSRKGRQHHDDDDDDDNEHRTVRIDLSRAKNLARQAAEQANGGLRFYRAEASMHGPAKLCPYVDHGKYWTFTFKGSRVGSTMMTIETVVTVYKNSPKVVVAYNGPIRTARQTQLVSFTSSQRTVLTNMLRGNCTCNHLLGSSLRTEIVSQVRSLPPGIQKQLLRGKGLPPGIAKKVRLPKQVNTYVNLPTYYDLFVVGSNVVLVDQVNYVVVDLIANVL